MEQAEIHPLPPDVLSEPENVQSVGGTAEPLAATPPPSSNPPTLEPEQEQD